MGEKQKILFLEFTANVIYFGFKIVGCNDFYELGVDQSKSHKTPFLSSNTFIASLGNDKTEGKFIVYMFTFLSKQF